jgi:hypothetical protein
MWPKISTDMASLSVVWPDRVCYDMIFKAILICDGGNDEIL